MFSTTVWLLTRNKLPAAKHCLIWHVKVKVKCSRYRPGVVQRVGRGIALLFHDRGTRSGWVVSGTPRPHFTPEKDPVPIIQKARWAPGSVWTGGKSRPHRDSIPDRPDRNSVTIPTELPGLHYMTCGVKNIGPCRQLQTKKVEHRLHSPENWGFRCKNEMTTFSRTLLTAMLHNRRSVVLITQACMKSSVNPCRMTRNAVE